MRQELKDIEKSMGDAVLALKERFKTLRTGRANLGLLDGVRVSAYGADVPINQVANLSVPEPTLIVAAPWDPAVTVAVANPLSEKYAVLRPSLLPGLLAAAQRNADKGIGEDVHQIFQQLSGLAPAIELGLARGHGLRKLLVDFRRLQFGEQLSGGDFRADVHQ